MVELETFYVKGAPILADMAFLRERHGDEGLQRIFDAMPAEVAERYRNEKILPGAWYTMTFRIALLQAMDKVFARGDPQYFFEVGRHQAEHNIKSYYKPFMKIVGPTMIIRLTKLFWSMIYKSGAVEVTAGDRSVTLEVAEYPKTGTYNCHTIRGYIHRTAEISGGNRKNVRGKEVACINRGDSSCRFVFEWDEE